MARSTFHWTSDTLTPGLKKFPDALDRAVAQTMDYFAPRVEGYARQNAPWHDQTGNARSGLRATTEHAGNQHTLILFHSVPYGIWLEVRWNGRYAIIGPTIDAQGPQLMNALRGVVERAT
jgi:hypothetical protein